MTQTDEGADLMDAIMAPLEGVESVVKDVESVVKDTPNTLPTVAKEINKDCLLYTSPSPRDRG